MTKRFDYGDNELQGGNFIWSKDTFHVDKKDGRAKEFIKFKKQHGFSPDECWSLFHTIAIFILPRIIKFKQDAVPISTPYGITQKGWNTVLNKMIYAFRHIAAESTDFPPASMVKKYGEQAATEKHRKKIQEGIDLFHEYFFALWW